MTISLFRIFNFDFKVLSIAFLFLAFIPIMSEGYYYEVVHFDIIFNKIFLTFIFLALLLSGSIRVISKPIYPDAMFLFGLGLIMMIFNVSMLFFVQDMNFVVTGLTLMLAPLIYSLNIVQLKKIITIVLITVISLEFLTLLDVVLNISLNPIAEIKYYRISEGLEGIRFQNNSLFGQKNAAGAVLSITFLLLLYIERLNLFSKDGKLFYFLSSLSFLFLLTTFSAGGIIIGFVGFLLWLVKKPRHGFSIRIVFFLCILWMLWFVLSQDFGLLLDRKLFSALAKLERIYAFSLLLFEDPSILLFGFNAFNNVPFYTESTFLDMLLNFGILIPIVLICFIIYMIVKTYFLKQFSLSFIYIAILFFLMSQNSAFLVPSIIIFLIAGGFHKKNIVLQGNASILEESNI
jgi:hypothetical protein